MVGLDLEYLLNCLFGVSFAGNCVVACFGFCV